MVTVGDRITVNANEALGTEECQATVEEVTDFGYIVHLDGDDPEWVGPVNWNFDIVDWTGVGPISSWDELE